MSRAPLEYNIARAAPIAAGIDVDQPIAGHYRARLRRGGVSVGIRIWFGSPIEPWTGEEMDRAPRWNATANGKWIDLDRVWPRCLTDPISKAEHDYLATLQGWGVDNGVDALADPTIPVDRLQSPLMF